MAKSHAPRFDAAALAKAVHAAAIGLAIETNDPQTFRRRMYEHMAKNPTDKMQILQGSTPSSFFLVKASYTPEAPAEA